MSSTYTLYPSSIPDGSPARRDRLNEPRSLPSNDSQHQLSPSTPVANTHLSAFSPQPQLRSSSSSPNLNSHTPAESTTLSIHYQSSEFSDTEDPFFGINFNTIEGASPDFLDDDFFRSAEAQVNDHAVPQIQGNTAHHVPQDPAYLPLSPDRTPSLHTPSPNSERKGDRATFPAHQQSRVAARGLTHLTTRPLDGPQSGYQYTPENSGSGRSSEDGLAPAVTMMSAQSPRLTVSMWTRDGAGVPYPLDTDQNLSTFNDISDDGSYDHTDAVPGDSAARDNQGRWVPDQATGQAGLSPDNRPVTEGASMNELAAKRKVDERNEQVSDWVATTPVLGPDPATINQPPPRPDDIADDTLPKGEIDANAETENVPVSGQTYYTGKGGELTEEDVDLIRRNRNWEAAPLPFEIARSRYQPQTSQAAIEKFERACRDNDSVVSMAATWGTRRRSLPMIDVEGITSGSFLKKLSISRGEPGGRRPSLLQELRGLVRKPSNALTKRPRGEEGETGSIETTSSAERQPSFGPPGRQMSWGKKQPVPSINTAFVAMGHSVASIASTHARSGSISATPTITSPTPKSPGGFGLAVKKPLRLRSKSDLRGQSSSLADMWKKQGGPPVSSLANPTVVTGDADDEDDDEDEIYEDAEMRSEANKMIDDIAPTFSGFQQHILKLNPMLAQTNSYLVDRIAHQQIIRYKSLLNARVKHLQCTANRNCPCGSMCIALGGSANVLDQRGDAKGMEPMSARYDSDGDVTPLEGPGVITQESFPQDIPMPPATILPAEFECQLCFQAKKFQKPSDWTKHVHEDVQPFTCTWDRCRDPKIFKRKADWVRHENEGHRHLEWWDCDVEDCRHVCYRRDNFLQHLVREHKYPEPKVKTKAAIKRAGGLDPTWQKVEQCHKETRDMPYNEPCRFCGKTFPTWKKLTVHLAKHMEQISLPILKLVARKELEADTIISPVQDPPPRPFATSFSVKPEPQPFDLSPTNHQMAQAMGYPSAQQQQPQQPSMMYPIVPPNFEQSRVVYGANNFNSIPQNMARQQLNVQAAPNHGVNAFPNLNMQSYPGSLPVTTAGAYNLQGQYMVSPDGQFGALNALGLQDPSVAAAVYNGMMDPNSAVSEQQHYTPQGSVSPYAHSPHQGPGGFYGQ
ncbi:hypothetical protein OQA88_3725 [Cercophora sp. LCS_1]